MITRSYVIYPVEDIDSIVFADLLTTSAGTGRRSNDGTQILIKFTGDTPSWLEGKTIYSRTQIHSILNDPDGGWYTDENS
jgi:hypothetical protein